MACQPQRGAERLPSSLDSHPCQTSGSTLSSTLPHMPLTPPAEPGNNSDIYTRLDMHWRNRTINDDQNKGDKTLWIPFKLNKNSGLGKPNLMGKRQLNLHQFINWINQFINLKSHKVLYLKFNSECNLLATGTKLSQLLVSKGTVLCGLQVPQVLTLHWSCDCKFLSEYLKIVVASFTI